MCTQCFHGIEGAPVRGVKIAINPHWKLELVQQGPHICLTEAEELVAFFLAVHVLEAPYHNAVDALLPTASMQRQSKHLKQKNGAGHTDCPSYLSADTCYGEPYHRGAHHEST